MGEEVGGEVGFLGGISVAVMPVGLSTSISLHLCLLQEKYIFLLTVIIFIYLFIYLFILVNLQIEF